MALAAAAGIAAAGAYLDAKYHVAKDVRLIHGMRARETDWAKAYKEQRHSAYYLFEDHALAQGDNARCIWSRDRSYTWKQAYALVHQFGNFYLSKGVKRPELVSFCLTNSPEFLTALLGTWSIGTGATLINYNLSGDALFHCLKQSRARLLLVDEDSGVRGRIEELRGRIESELGMEIFVLDAAGFEHVKSFSAAQPDQSLRLAVEATDSAHVIFTSGTTGLPKACPFQVKRTYASCGTRSKTVSEAGGTPACWYVCMPMYHGTGLILALMTITSGWPVAVAKKFRVSTFWQDIRDSGSTGFVYVGETARYLLAQPPSPLDQAHTAKAMFGNGLRPDVWKRFRDRFGIDSIIEFFNSTEGVFSLINFSRGDFTAQSVGHHGLILRLLMQNTYVPVEVSPHDGSLERDPSTGLCRRTTYEEGGEMLVKVPSEAESGFAGYVNNPEATKKRFARDVFVKGDLYYRSGDALRRDAEGRWYFLDRLGDTFRWKSENVSTAEVAVVCGEYPGVVEANVYGVLVPGHDGRAGCAALFIDPATRQSFDFAAFLKSLKAKLPQYSVPPFLRLVKDVAPMHNNKQNKVPLRNEGIDVAKVNSPDGTSPDDALYWIKPGSNTYVPFGKADYEALVAGKAKL